MSKRRSFAFAGCSNPDAAARLSGPPITIAILLLLFPLVAAGQDSQRFEAGIVFSGTRLKEIGSTDSGIGTSGVGIGGRLAYELSRNLDLDTELSVWPNNPATSGAWIQGLVGVKAGKRMDRFGLFAKVRPGFMHFRKDPFGVSKPGSSGVFGRNWAASTEPQVDLGGAIEYRTRRDLMIRFDLGDMIIHYGRRQVFVSQLDPGREAGGFTSHNWQGSLGLGFRF